MKTIDTKSLLVGVIASCIIFTLTSSKMPEGVDSLEFAPYNGGVGLYNTHTKILYLYKTDGVATLKSKPAQVFKIAEDGSRLFEEK